MTLIKQERLFVLLCVLFLGITTLFSATWFAHQINPDATSYFTIAEKYAHFEWAAAVNGYWGPLFSWLLVPAVWLGIPLEVAARVATTLAGIGLLILAYYVLRVRGNASRTLALAICLIMAIMTFSWILLGAVSPDLIFTFFTVLCTVLLLRFLDKPDRSGAIALGVTGALLYFTKGFGLYLFIAVVGLTMAGWWWQRRQSGWRAALRPWIPVWLVFFIMIAPFAAALSVKYNQPTLNTTGAYVSRVIGPATLGGQPMLSRGPLEPPNRSAASIWEDPTLMTPLMPDWSPLESADNRSFFWHKVIWRNLNVSLETIQKAGALAGTAVVVMLAGCLGRKNRREFVIFSLTSLVLTAGYALILTEARYLWPMLVLAIISLGVWLARLEQKQLLSRLQITLAAAAIGLLMLLPLPTPMRDSRLSAQEMHAQAQAIGRFIPQQSRAIADNFMEYHTCYYLELRCYAVLETPPEGQEAAYAARLKATGITHFINYHSRDTDPRFMHFIATYFEETGAVRMQTRHPLTPVLVTIYRLR
jgi:4-amino-4-deoxy-L-arabinose transferase-like glycosyltransferase